MNDALDQYLNLAKAKKTDVEGFFILSSTVSIKSRFYVLSSIAKHGAKATQSEAGRLELQTLCNRKVKIFFVGGANTFLADPVGGMEAIASTISTAKPKKRKNMDVNSSSKHTNLGDGSSDPLEVFGPDAGPAHKRSRLGNPASPFEDGRGTKMSCKLSPLVVSKMTNGSSSAVVAIKEGGTPESIGSQFEDGRDNQMTQELYPVITNMKGSKTKGGVFDTPSSTGSDYADGRDNEMSQTLGPLLQLMHSRDRVEMETLTKVGTTGNDGNMTLSPVSPKEDKREAGGRLAFASVGKDVAKTPGSDYEAEINNDMSQKLTPLIQNMQGKAAKKAAKKAKKKHKVEESLWDEP